MMPNSLKLLNHYILSNAPQKHVSRPLNLVISSCCFDENGNEGLPEGFWGGREHANLNWGTGNRVQKFENKFENNFRNKGTQANL